VEVYADTRRFFEALPPPAIPRAEIIDEFYDAIMRDKPPVHDGAWARATTETCLGILESARTQTEFVPRHQVAPA